jgi:hypothetical protein
MAAFIIHQAEGIVRDREFDITKCYIVAFADDAGNIHSVVFPLGDDANRRASELKRALGAIGLQAEKFGSFHRREPHRSTRLAGLRADK